HVDQTDGEDHSGHRHVDGTDAPDEPAAPHRHARECRSRGLVREDGSSRPSGGAGPGAVVESRRRRAAVRCAVSDPTASKGAIMSALPTSTATSQVTSDSRPARFGMVSLALGIVAAGLTMTLSLMSLVLGALALALGGIGMSRRENPLPAAI